MHRRWISLPLLSTCVTAFYPYHDKTSESKRFIPIHLEEAGQDERITMNLKKVPVHKRGNSFNVVYSNPPDQVNALAIDEDGQDSSYFAQVKFGSKAQEMFMLIDTGSPNTWVMGQNCTSSACQIHNTFGATGSTTLDVTQQTWSLTYGTGEVQGVVGSDTVAFANYSLDMSFGLATTASDDFNNYPMDGILGLGRPSSDALNIPTVMQALDSQAKLPSNIVGVHLERNSDGAKDGQITFGGIDNSKFTGQINYNPTIDTSGWEIAVDDAIVSGSACNFQAKSAIIDTGTSYILMPQADAQTLHNLIPGSKESGEQFTIPCGTTTSVQIKMSGISYTISPEDYVGAGSGSLCTSNIIGHQAFGANQWILGDTFLKNVYTVFNFDNASVGFGVLGAKAASSSSTSITAAPSSSSQSHSTSSGVLSTSAPKSSTSPTTASTTHPASASTSASSSSSPISASPSPSSDGSPFGSSTPSSAAPVEAVRLAFIVALAFIVSIVIQ